MKTHHYQTPSILVNEITIEKGFAQSGFGSGANTEEMILDSSLSFDDNYNNY